MKIKTLRSSSYILTISILCTIAFVGISQASGKYPPATEALPPMKVLGTDGQVEEIGLTDVYDHYGGHTCPGLTMSFMALSYGTSMLFTDGEPVNFEDLVIFARAPGGPIDLLDFFVKGRDNTKRTWPPSGMISGMKSFTFDFMRKSTLQGVHVELQDGLWPSDWFELKKKKKTGTITKQEEQKQNDNRAYVLNQFPLKSFQELFGTPRPYTFVGWGTLESGEMDKLIRAQRHRSRK